MRLPGVEEDLVYVGEEVVARVVQYPGWRWSNDMRAIAGGQWCESHHVGVTLSGRQGVVLRDGTVLEFGPDDVYDIPPGLRGPRASAPQGDSRATSPLRSVGGPG